MDGKLCSHLEWPYIIILKIYRAAIINPKEHAPNPEKNTVPYGSRSNTGIPNFHMHTVLNLINLISLQRMEKNNNNFNFEKHTFFW